MNYLIVLQVFIITFHVARRSNCLNIYLITDVVVKSEKFGYQMFERMLQEHVS